MKIDFHQGAKAATHTRGQTKPLVIPAIWKRLIGLLAALFGIVLILLSLSTLLLSKAVTPYALLFFEHADPKAPQTHAHMIWINEDRNSVLVTDVPDKVEFHSQSLGTYPLASIYAAHLTTKQPQSDFLTDLSFYFRFPIQGYLMSTKPVSPSKLALVRFVTNACFFSNDRSLSVGQCLHLLAFVSSLSTSVHNLDFPQSALGSGTMESIAPLDRTKYREWSQAHFAESFKIWKKYTVAILNGTDTSGLANTASGILQDFGLSVLYVGEARAPQQNGEIVINSEVSKQPVLVEFLKETLRLPSRVDDTMTTQYRSDVVVVIGEHEAKFFAP